MVTVVDEACRIEGGKLLMVLESNSLPELLENRVIKFAIEEAARFGWPNACLNGQLPPEPVDKNGKTPENYEELTKLANDPDVRYWKKILLVTRF